jgi:DNA-binding NarL/FixJ family response regulator
MTTTMTEKQNITIVLIDDQAIVRAAFRSLLSQSPRFEVVGDRRCPAGIGWSATAANIIILDITMPVIRRVLAPRC